MAKVRLRCDAVDRIGKSTVWVLDAYAGYGRMWREVQRQRPHIQIRTLGIDQRDIGPHLIRGDNMKVLPGLDLDRFDLVDLDAYGVPAKQLKVVAGRAPDVPVLTTAIISTQGRSSNVLLDALGMPIEWGGVSPSLLRQVHWEAWDTLCYDLGFRTSIGYEFRDVGMHKRYQLLLH